MGPPGPNELTGEVSVGTIIADLSGDGSCQGMLAMGSGTVDCVVDKASDPLNPYIIAQFVCPEGTTALQAGCVGTGAQAWLTATIQDVNIVQCFYRFPPAELNYAVSVTATCVDLAIISAQGVAIKPTAILVKDHTAAKLKAKIMG